MTKVTFISKLLILAIIAYKKLLQIAWINDSVDFEMRAYDGMSMQYYHKSDITRWKYYLQKGDNRDFEEKNTYVRFLNELNYK